MQAQDQQIDGLQQKASAHYLQGEFDQALRAWRQVLLLEPENEQALEGVRLCEMLGEANGGPEAEASEPAPAGVEAGPVEDLDDLDDLDRLLDARTGGAAIDPAAGDRVPDLPDLDAPPSEPEPLGASQAAAPKADAVADLDFDFTELEDGPGTSPPSTDATSEAELRLRALELLNDAHKAYDLGEGEKALGILNRLFILDETHSAALELQAKIHAESGVASAPAAAPVGHDAPATAPVSDAAPPTSPAVDDLSPNLGDAPPEAAAAADQSIDLVGFDPIMPDIAPAQENLGPDEEAELDDPFDEAGGVEDDSMAGDDELPALDAGEETELEPLAKGSGGGKKKLIIAACTVVVVAGGLFAGLKFMGGEPAAERPTEEEIIASLGLPSAEAQDPSGNQGLTPEQSAAEAAAAAAEHRRAVNEALDRGTAAMAAEDYAAAVMAYNDVIRLDPENQTAEQQLTLAGEKYREQKQTLEQWEAAIRSFNDGNYRGALAAFYRLPEGDNAERLVRYKRNGWYNMGVQALISGNCNDAKSHFAEARAIDSQDAGVSKGAELTALCRTNAASLEYRRSLEQLTFRGIED